MENFEFELALPLLRGGKRVGRHGWNGKGMWLEIQTPDANSKMTLPYIFLNYPASGVGPYPEGARVPWAPSQTDLLCVDWMVL